MKLHKFTSFNESMEEHNHIVDLCRKYRVEKYKINDDLTVDVNGGVYLYNLHLKELPFQFGEVRSDFHCNNNQLTTLDGSPYQTKDFYCGYNQLTSLIGGPKIVEGHFECYHNQLTSLIGTPKQVKRLYCHFNQITSLVGVPDNLEFFQCNDNPVAEIWELFNKDLRLLEVFDLYNLFQVPGVIDSAVVEEIAHHLGQKLATDWTLKNYQVI